MKILLVNPPNPDCYYNKEVYFPSALLYLCAALRKNGEEVKVLDLKCYKYENQDNHPGCYEKALVEAVASFGPDIIGFGCLFSGNFRQLLALSETVKEKFKEIPVLSGGIHPTIYASEILQKCPSIDWVILGEGEQAIVQLVNAVKNRSQSFKDIDGFAYREGGRIFVNPKKHFIGDIDTIAFPDYGSINFKDYHVDTTRWHNPKRLPINTSVPIISSRSCPNRCNFCSMFLAMGPKWRGRSPENVVDEIEYVYKEYNHRHFSFMDDNFSLNKPRALDICKLILKRKLDLQFETPNGLSISTLDEEVLDALTCAGLVRTYLAIESGSDFIRNKIMRKNLSKEKIYEVVTLAKKYKQLDIAAFFIIGMPEETKETLADTYNMIREIKVNRVFLMNVVPFPGTEVFQQALRDNLLTDTEPDQLYLASDRFLTNYQRVFLKPYKLELEDLYEFRRRCESSLGIKKQEKPLSALLKNE